MMVGYTGGAMIKKPPANVGDVGSIPGSGRSPRVGNGNSLQYSCLGRFLRQSRLADYGPWRHKVSDMTERLTMYTHAEMMVVAGAIHVFSQRQEGRSTSTGFKLDFLLCLGLRKN